MSADNKVNEQTQPAADADQAPAAWEEIEAGRFQPRRIRGSCRGRMLG